MPDTGENYTEALAMQQIGVNLLAPLDLARLMAQQHPADAIAARCAIHVLDQKGLQPQPWTISATPPANWRWSAPYPCKRRHWRPVCGYVAAPGLLFQSGPQQADNFAAASHANLLRRPIHPQDVARTCVFLAQTPAITGATLCVDNGPASGTLAA